MFLLWVFVYMYTHTHTCTYFDFITFSGNDFVSLNGVPLVFNPLDPINTRRCVNITIINENLVEYDEQFTVFLEPVGPVRIIPDINKTITILNDDCK